MEKLTKVIKFGFKIEAVAVEGLSLSCWEVLKKVDLFYDLSVGPKSTKQLKC